MKLRLFPRSWKGCVVLLLAASSVAGSLMAYRPVQFYLAMRSGKYALKRRRVEVALGHFSRAAELKPDSGEAEFYLARTQRKLGRLDLVRKHIERAYELDYPVKRLRREQWLAEAQSGQMRLAEPHIHEMLNDPGEDGREIIEAFVAGYLRLLRYEKIGLMLDTWKKEYPQDAQSHYYEGRIFADQQKHRDAEAAFRRALELDAERVDVRVDLAHALEQLQRLDEAEVAFRECIAKEPKNRIAILGLVRCLVNKQENKEATELLNGILKRDPQYAAARLSLARIALADGNHQKTIELLEPIAEDHARNIVLRQTFAAALRAAGRVDEARTHLEFVVAAEKAGARVHNLRSELLKNPTDVGKRFEICRLLMEFESQDEAAIWLNSVLEFQPHHPGARKMLFDYYEERGRPDLARRYR